MLTLPHLRFLVFCICNRNQVRTSKWYTSTSMGFVGMNQSVKAATCHIKAWTIFCWSCTPLFTQFCSCVILKICYRSRHAAGIKWMLSFSWYVLKMYIKTNSPKQVETKVHFTTISGHFLANPFNIFHKTEGLLVILN